MNNDIKSSVNQSFAERIKLKDRVLWIILVFFVWYIVIGETLDMGFLSIFQRLDVPASWVFVLKYYTSTIGGVIALFLLCRTNKNRFVWESFMPRSGRRSSSYLGAGLLLGFLMNFFCILCALLHGDIKLVFDFSLSGIPLMIFGLLSVFIQSSAEEIWTRGFLYERISVHYPLWLAIVVNGTLFGLLHSTNDGITPFAMADLIICGISFSLLRWYSGSIWTCMGVHTMWNYTQNLIFGLPNSGLVSETSVFHLGAANGISNLIYDYTFGVEGAVPALFIDVLLGAVCLYLGWRAGRLGELLLSKEQALQTHRI